MTIKAENALRSFQPNMLAAAAGSANLNSSMDKNCIQNISLSLKCELTRS